MVIVHPRNQNQKSDQREPSHPLNIIMIGRDPIKYTPAERQRYKMGKPKLTPLQRRKEDEKFRNSTELLLRKLPFQQLVREIAHKIDPQTQPRRFQATGIGALQEAAEAFLLMLFGYGAECMNLGGRVTLMKKDLELVYKLQGFARPSA